MKINMPQSVRAGMPIGAAHTLVSAVACFPVGSSVLVTFAVFVMVVQRGWGVIFTCTTIVIIADPPGFIVPRSQVTLAFPLLVQPDPCVAEAETNDTPEGSVSTTTTLVESEGPPFETLIV